MRFWGTAAIGMALLMCSSIYGKESGGLRRAQHYPQSVVIGRLETGPEVLAVQSKPGQWGIEVRSPALSSLKQTQPVQIELYQDESRISTLASGYSSVKKSGKSVIGQAELGAPGGVTFRVEDRWAMAGPVLRVERSVKVSGNAPGGFLTAVKFITEKGFSWPDLDYFAPGRLYGGPEHLLEVAPGGMLNYGSGRVEMREDALPMPLFGIYFRDGSSVAVLDPQPKGDTTAADGREREASLIDERFQFGALGGCEKPEGGVEFGFWLPGTVSRVIRDQQGGPVRKWRRRYHPIRDGFSQRYVVALRFGREERFHDFYKGAWRWGWKELKPQVNHHDIEKVRRSLIDLLAGRVETIDGRTGIGFWADADAKSAASGYQKSEWQVGMEKAAIMGFCGKNLEAAAFLLEEAERDKTARGSELRRLGLAIFDSFVRMKVSPPDGEGFYLDTGKPAFTTFRSEKAFLRSFTEDMAMMLKAYARERERGSDHPEWLRWCREFADWLLTQQRGDGSFPRCWKGGTGEVIDAAPESTYNGITFLTLLSQQTGEPKYMDAALRAAEFCWITDQSRDQYVGGTIDNPNITDKEAGTLSMEAYLLLYEVTGRKKWLDRAAAAADFAETWVYAWNVPMPADEDDAELHWKKGVSTVGVNLINSTGGGVDQWMAYAPDEYAKLYAYTKDPHYLEVARILLHNTKNMLAVPGRLYDLRGPGWQQEHWGIEARRGFGGHRWWLPWVSTSHLNGILGLEEFDPVLFRELADGKRGK